MVVDVTLDDYTLTAVLAEIVQELTKNDDSKGSVRMIKTDDHPDGLLAAVQKKLEQTSSKPNHSASQGPPKLRSDTSLLTVAHLRLLRSIAATLAIPKGYAG
jgi:hypothetical protein